MTDLLSEPNGQGGAGGDLVVSGGAKTARGFVELVDVAPGKYDILAVCTGADIVHLVVKTRSRSSVLASSDIVCGASLRLPVTVAEKGLVLEATNTGKPAQWQAAIVTPGWNPVPTTYQH